MTVVLAQSQVLVYGKHVVGDLYGCNEEKLKDVVFLMDVIKKAATVGNMTLLEVKSWKIGYGVSVFGIILESHISIHTWPEYSFATVDVYSCGKHTEPEKAFDFIATALNAKHIKKKVFIRNYEV